MQVGYHTDATTCMMFLTSMAGNPLCVGLAASAVGVEITWTNWRWPPLSRDSSRSRLFLG